MSDERPAALLAAVVFDFDGTLADTQIDFQGMRKNVVDVLKRVGAWDDALEGQRYILEMIDAACLLAMRRGLDVDAVRQWALAAAHEVEIEACSVAPLCPGAADALRRLRDAGLMIGIITRNCQAGVDAVLSRHHLDVDILIPREVAEAAKPNPAHLLQALDLLGVSPARAAMVGDHVTDIQCAVQAGALPVAVAGASSSPEELSAEGAAFVATNLAEAVDFLLTRAAGA
jgi:phosphoglycolate phosphatase